MSGPKSRWIAALFTLAIAAIVAVGCGGDSDNGGDGGSDKPAADQTLTMNIGADPEGFDPATASYLDTFNVLTALFAGLYRLTGDDSELTPWLAEELPEISDDGLTYTVKLREDAKWSDGQPLTAEDVVFGVRRSLDPELGAYYATFLHSIVGACEYNTSGTSEGEAAGADEEACGGLKTDRKPESIGVRAVDDYTVEFKLEKAVPWFDQLMTVGAMYPQPKHAIEKFGDKWLEPENLVTSGAFTLESYKRRDRIVLTKNPEFWNADDVKLDRIVMRMVGEPATANRLFEEEKLDTGFTRTLVPPAEIDQWKSDERYRDVGTTATQYLYINTTNPALKDPKVRQGIALAIDRQSIAENVTKKGDRPSRTVIPDNIPGYDTIEEASQDFLPTDSAPDVDKAKEALEEGGWEDGTELSLYFDSTGANGAAVGEQIQSDLKKVGVDVKLVPLPGDQIAVPGVGISPIGEKVDLILQGWIADYLDAQNFYQLFTCGNVEAGLNSANYCDKEYDKVYAQALETVDVDARTELYKELEGMLTGPDGGMPVVPIYQETDNTLVQPWVEGFDIIPSGFLYYEDVVINEH